MDIVSTSKKLKIGFADANRKTSTITLNGVDSNVTAENIRSAAQYIVDNGILLNSDGDSYTSVVTAYSDAETIRTLDIS